MKFELSFSKRNEFEFSKRIGWKNNFKICNIQNINKFIHKILRSSRLPYEFLNRFKQLKQYLFFFLQSAHIIHIEISK